MQQAVKIKSITWQKVLPQVCFWLLITLLFLYERRYLIHKAGLPNFIACVSVRLALIMGLAYLNLYVLIPRFFNRQRYVVFTLLLIVSLALYVGLQSAYDMFLFGFIIGDTRYAQFWRSLPYNAVSSAWYLLITVSFKISLDWFRHKKDLAAAADSVEIKTEAPEYLYLKSGLKTVKVCIAEIIYIQALKDYSIIYTNADKVITKGSLKHVEEILPAGYFLRVHKSYIIAKSKIASVERTKVVLNGRVSVPVGRSFQDRLEGF
ncbi:LytTR family transcriptional regulator [Mucilaginibacter terrigena]|uniref:LytTR family transcriptional regulator n=1 Tax=Mucilaginibacter terrigena TaxID=2492395 RepID=A0A4Q5LMN2_9SPHI|nr:LytTR family DNA-binding domain-containing protein [Mucilaginibacter terrigena]RYU89246.1 LytTR family transcriptional regulator [Mucilaginibacter terrigena]